MTALHDNTYDAILCVGPNPNDIVVYAIQSIYHFSDAKTIFVITSSKNFPFFSKLLTSVLTLVLIDEDTLIRETRLTTVQESLLELGASKKRAGWYFQQFLKIAIAKHPEISTHYLIWDSDSIMLNHLDFFHSDGTYVNPAKENHTPYFDFIKRVLDIDKQVDYSFISEHFMVKTAYMKELLEQFNTSAPKNSSWCQYILTQIPVDDLNASGFSEYETYGNFTVARHPTYLKSRILHSTRNAVNYYGLTPSTSDIYSLMQQQYDFVTFETWQPTSKRRIYRYKAVALIKYALDTLFQSNPVLREHAKSLTH